MSIQRSSDTEALFAGLGAPDVVAFQAPVGGVGQPLLPEEFELTSMMSPRRRAGFAAGRAAARAGLDLIGLDQQPILIGPGGAPLWPTGVTGSITHTDHVAYAAVTIDDTAASPGGPTVALGIDVEIRGRVQRDVVGLIMTAGEQARWNEMDPSGADPSEADAFATVAFSAKEALYKAQFVLTGAWLGFEHVEFADAGISGTTDGTLVETEHSPLDQWIERPLRTRSLVSAEQVISAVLLRRRASPTRSS